MFRSLTAIRWRTVDLRSLRLSFWAYVLSLYGSALHVYHRASKAKRDPRWQDGFDIVTVVYGAEIDFLRLQARSFDRFLNEDFEGEIIVVVNDIQTRRVARWVETLVLPDYGRWRSRVRIVPFHALAYRLDPSNGWIIQQVLKLTVATIVTRQSYVVFDAKNHLIAPVSAGTFFDRDGRILQPLQTGVRSLPQHQEVCARYFGIDLSDPNISQFIPMTPFVMHTASVERMIRHIENKEGRRISDVFCDRRCLAEFLLYGAFLNACDGGIEILYADVDMRAITLWAEGASLRDAIEDARDGGGIVCFAVHRLYLACLDSAGRQTLETFWRQRGLLGDGERLSSADGLRVIESGTSHLRRAENPND